MNRILSKYLLTTVKKAKKINIKPVKIDFPLPTGIQGIEKRINSVNTYALPEIFLKKNRPEHLVGKNVRLTHLLSNW